MSGRLPRETTVPKVVEPQDEYQGDSGYLSGPLETASGDIVSGDACGADTVGLSRCLASCRITNFKESAQRPRSPTSKDTPWQILFVQDDENGDTQLHLAAERGCYQSVDTILSSCPVRELLDIQNDFDETALHLAVIRGHHRIVEKLVLAGARIDCRDCLGETPVHKAATSGNKNCMQALLHPPSGNKSHVTSAALNQKNFNGQTSIHIAAMGAHTELIQMLVHYGADVNAREGLGGYTVLHMAAERGDAVLAGYLLDACSTLALGEHNYAGKTARHLAARNRVAKLFAKHPLRDDEDYLPSSDDEEDDDDDLEREENLFSRLQGMDRSIPVA